MKKNIWLTLAALSLIGMALAPKLHAAGSILPSRPIPNVTPIPRLPVVPIPPLSIVPSVNLPGVPSPMPIAPRFTLAAAPAAPVAPAVPVAPKAPVTEITFIQGEKIILPGAFNPNSPVKMPEVGGNTKKIEARLSALFDGSNKKQPTPVPVDTMEEPEIEPVRPVNRGSSQPGHVSLPEQDLANEIGF